MNQRNDNGEDGVQKEQPDSSIAVAGQVLAQQDEVVTETETEPDTQAPEPGTDEVRKCTCSPWPLLLACLVVLAIAAAGGYFLWQDGKLQRLALRQELQDLQAAQERQWQERHEQDNQALHALEQKQAEMHDAVTRAHEIASRSSSDWVLAEVEYLLLIANQRLQLQQDAGTALRALQLADTRLRDLANPAMTGVRAAIKGEIDALQALRLPDYSGLALQLAALSNRIEGLKLRTADPRPAADGPATGGVLQGIDKNNWKEVLAGLWDELKVLVVVRRRDHEILPMMMPEQEQMVRQSLRLKLEAARILVLQREQAGFVQTLEGAGAWLRDYFELEDAGVTSMLQALQELQQTDLQPHIPDISASLRELRAVMQGGEQ